MRTVYTFIQASAIGILLGALLYVILTAALGAYPPSAVVASCSMAPLFEPGDSVVIGSPEEINAYEITMTGEQLSELTNPLVTVFSQKYSAKRIINSSFLNYCMTSPDRLCSIFLEDPGAFVEKRGPLSFVYGYCQVGSDWRTIRKPCVESVIFDNSEYKFNSSHDIVVFRSFRNGSEEHIIHRAFFKINAEGRQYLMTQGDNALLFDLQGEENSIVPAEDVKGKALFKIPVIGNLRLFSSGYASQNCLDDIVRREAG